MIKKEQTDAVLLWVGDYLCYTNQDRALQLIINSGRFPVRKPSDISTRLNLSTLRSFLASKKELFCGSSHSSVPTAAATSGDGGDCGNDEFDELDENNDDDDAGEITWNIIVTLVNTVSRNFPELSEEKFECLNNIYTLGVYEAFTKASVSSSIDEFKSEVSILSSCCGSDAVEGSPFFRAVQKETESYPILHEKLGVLFKTVDISETFSRLFAYVDRISSLLKAPILCAIKSDIENGSYVPSSMFGKPEAPKKKPGAPAFSAPKNDSFGRNKSGKEKKISVPVPDLSGDDDVMNKVRAGEVPNFTLSELKSLVSSEEEWNTIVNFSSPRPSKKPSVEIISDDDEANNTSSEHYSNECSLDLNGPHIKHKPVNRVQVTDVNRAKRYPNAQNTVILSKSGAASVASHSKKAFTEEEVNNLKEGVKQFGVGQWSVILKHYEFNNRTSVDLKDKWRNILRKEKRDKGRDSVHCQVSKQKSRVPQGPPPQKVSKPNSPDDVSEPPVNCLRAMVATAADVQPLTDDEGVDWSFVGCDDEEEDEKEKEKEDDGGKKDIDENDGDNDTENDDVSGKSDEGDDDENDGRNDWDEEEDDANLNNKSDISYTSEENDEGEEEEEKEYDEEDYEPQTQSF